VRRAHTAAKSYADPKPPNTPLLLTRSAGGSTAYVLPPAVLFNSISSSLPLSPCLGVGAVQPGRVLSRSMPWTGPCHVMCWTRGRHSCVAAVFSLVVRENNKVTNAPRKVTTTRRQHRTSFDLGTVPSE
jgi:hypothetical protein